jgi:hypothetical protein
MRGIKVFAVAAIGGLFLALSAVGAAAETQTIHGATETFADYVPCVTEFPSLDAFEITITFNAVEHFNENKNGVHFTFTSEGTFSAVPVFLADNNGDGEPDFDEATESFAIAGPREGESFTGKFTNWGGGNINRSGTASFTFTFSGHGTGDEGSSVKWNFNDHITSEGDPFEDPAAIIKVAFSNVRCH